jgi:hypothetical protein
MKSMSGKKAAAMTRKSACMGERGNIDTEIANVMALIKQFQVII